MAMLFRWRAIADRIRGIRDAANLMAQFLQANNSDSYKMAVSLGQECRQVLIAIKQFDTDFSGQLPQSTRQRIAEFVERRNDVIEGGAQDAPAARASVVLITALGSELTFLLSGEQEAIRSRAERAFLHLQRLIVANPADAQVWQEALGKGETRCEKLGGAHLLVHGIYAFKIDATGGRTDLVFPEPINPEDVSRSASGLVLTEWKVANDDAEAVNRFKEARIQADLYQEGPLGGLELASHRYLVVVTKNRISPSMLPLDTHMENVIYRHINIAVSPLVPSAQSKRRT
jgi:hypothetical protein